MKQNIWIILLMVILIINIIRIILLSNDYSKFDKIIRILVPIMGILTLLFNNSIVITFSLFLLFFYILEIINPNLFGKL